MSNKNDRIASIIKKNVSSILQYEITNKSVGFVTVTDVEVTNDLSFAKIYVTFLDDEKHLKTHMEALENVKGLVRSKLAKTLSTRKCPELIFSYDNSLNLGNRIDSIIKELNSKADN
ncbi:MAG: 30S ribosome-binding factor RbfA [Erysipelotrichaceae bacterium]|nr:30S ribosome-binding factor RbfA [Erysipelotrichaceae bacterium]